MWVQNTRKQVCTTHLYLSKLFYHSVFRSTNYTKGGKSSKKHSNTQSKPCKGSNSHCLTKLTALCFTVIWYTQNMTSLWMLTLFSSLLYPPPQDFLYVCILCTSTVKPENLEDPHKPWFKKHLILNAPTKASNTMSQTNTDLTWLFCGYIYIYI